MNSQIEIVPLTAKRLKEATNLLNNVFDDEESNPCNELKASLCEKSFRKYRKKIDNEVTYMKYYVALQSDTIVGIVGVYKLTEDCENTAWLGWYGVSPQARGYGIGSKLLQFAIDLVKSMGMTYFSLYTSTDKNERAAQLIYEKYGFSITAVEQKKGYDILYRRKVL